MYNTHEAYKYNERLYPVTARSRQSVFSSKLSPARRLASNYDRRPILSTRSHPLVHNRWTRSRARQRRHPSATISLRGARMMVQRPAARRPNDFYRRVSFDRFGPEDGRYKLIATTVGNAGFRNVGRPVFSGGPVFQLHMSDVSTVRVHLTYNLSVIL